MDKRTENDYRLLEPVLSRNHGACNPTSVPSQAAEEVMRNSCVLSTSELCFSYGGRKAVDDVNLKLQAGTLTALVGPNGAGKSTLLHLLEGRLKPSRGSINSGKRIGLMPQRAAIDWSFPITAEEMVRLGTPSKRNSTTTNQQPEQLLERVGMGAMGGRRLSQLSGGQQHRVLLARALMQQSDILLLDEPCSAIDPPTRDHLLRVMREQTDAGQTLLVSSHDWGSALDDYDQVVVMDGQILANGSPKTVRDKLSDLTCMMGSHCCG